MSARASMPFRPYGFSLVGHVFGLTALVFVSSLGAPRLFVGGVSIVLPPPGSGPGAAKPEVALAGAEAPEPAPTQPPAPPPEERRRPQPEQNVVKEPSPEGTLPPPKGDVPSLRPEARDPVAAPEPSEPPTQTPPRAGAGAGAASGHPGGSSSPGEGTGIGVEGGVLGAHAPWYLVAVHDKIKSNWDFPAAVGREGEVQAVYRFRIHEDGHVSDVQAARKSNLVAYDMAAHRAILSASPLPPVPEDLGHQEIEITVTFTKVY